MAGYGIPGETVGLVWAVFAALLVWTLVQLLPFDLSWWLDVVWAFVMAVLAIVVWSFAFRNAPSGRSG
ncbi:hypothetical protein BC829DRAFT_404776 [Chytridium lagenaria]|nr:hypothetical protein BC829DRAFT_404776 [Chytridium lagenaria]